MPAGRRGGPPTRKPAGGHPPALSLAEQTLVTVLRLRFRPPHHVLAQLFGVVTGTIATAERQIRPLLDQCGYAIEPAGTRLRTLADLTAYAQAHGIVLTPKTNQRVNPLHAPTSASKISFHGAAWPAPCIGPRSQNPWLRNARDRAAARLAGLARGARQLALGNGQASGGFTCTLMSLDCYLTSARARR